MSFDCLAPHYRWMEWLLAGGKLQRCRTAFLPLLPPPRHALLLGEGNGRFLVEFLRAHPGTRFTCVDLSQRMLQRAQATLARARLDISAGRFIHADALDWLPSTETFDLIVSNFFLDCFPPEALEAVIRRVRQTAAPSARWLIADFREPSHGWRRWRARCILGLMYSFFRRLTALPTKRLTPPDEMLERAGFKLAARQLHEWGLLHSDLWELPPQSPGPKVDAPATSQKVPATLPA